MNSSHSDYVNEHLTARLMAQRRELRNDIFCEIHLATVDHVIYLLLIHEREFLASRCTIGYLDKAIVCIDSPRDNLFCTIYAADDDEDGVNNVEIDRTALDPKCGSIVTHDCITIPPRALNTSFIHELRKRLRGRENEHVIPTTTAACHSTTTHI